MKVQIRPVTAGDVEEVARIYNHYVCNSIATFEEDPVEVNDMADRVQSVRDASLPWLVAEQSDRIIGYAYANAWKTRSAYRHSAESSVYLDPGHMQQGIGIRLYRELLVHLPRKVIHTVIGGISLPNEASVALHEKLGFKKVAHFREIGFKFGKWIDVGYWQWWFDAQPRAVADA